MQFEDSLEQDVLDILWAKRQPLTVGQLKSELQQQYHLSVPYPYLERVLHYMEIAELIQTDSQDMGSIRYLPKMSRFRLNWQPLTVLITRYLRKTRRSQKRLGCWRRWFEQVRFFLDELLGRRTV